MRKLIDGLTWGYERLGWLKSPVVRHIAALTWTLMATVLLVQSSSQPVVGPAAPPGAPDLKREIWLTFGHIVVFSVLVGLWWWAMRGYRGDRGALFVAVGFAVVFGIITELSQQYTTNRSPSVYDVVVNLVVIGVTAVGVWKGVSKRSWAD